MKKSFLKDFNTLRGLVMVLFYQDAPPVFIKIVLTIWFSL